MAPALSQSDEQLVMTEAHTPTPWSAGIARRSDDGIIAAHIVGVNGENVAQLAIYEKHETVSTEANAALIVRAVNAHDDLVAAIMAAAEYLPPDSDADHLCADALARARAKGAA